MKIHKLDLDEDRTNFYFTKNKNECLLVEYNKRYDYGEFDPSGVNELEITIHYKNSWLKSSLIEISVNEVPKCIRDVLTYLK